MTIAQVPVHSAEIIAIPVDVAEYIVALEISFTLLNKPYSSEDWSNLGEFTRWKILQLPRIIAARPGILDSAAYKALGSKPNEAVILSYIDNLEKGIKVSSEPFNEGEWYSKEAFNKWKLTYSVNCLANIPKLIEDSATYGVAKITIPEFIESQRLDVAEHDHVELARKYAKKALELAAEYNKSNGYHNAFDIELILARIDQIVTSDYRETNWLPAAKNRASTFKI